MIEQPGLKITVPALRCVALMKTERVYLIPLVCFFWAGFLLLDRTIVAKWEKIGYDVLILVILQSAIGIVMIS